MWKHTRRPGQPSSFVTVLVDLTPVVDGTGPARLLDMTPGRSKKVLKTWLSQRDQDWRGRVEVVAMDGFTGSRECRWRGAAQGAGPQPGRIRRHHDTRRFGPEAARS